MNDHFECTTSHLENVSQLGLVSGVSSHGIGFFTGMCDFFCRFFGEENKMLTKKIEFSKSAAFSRMAQKAIKIGADGVMDFRYEITNHTTIIAYGTAFKKEKAIEDKG